MVSARDDVEQRACNASGQLFKKLFYNVTTLYFESFKADDLKIQRFSKDNKSQQPQTVISLPGTGWLRRENLCLS